MRYAIIFAATAAASEAYGGYGSYDDAKSSSTVGYAYQSSSSKVAYPSSSEVAYPSSSEVAYPSSSEIGYPSSSSEIGYASSSAKVVYPSSKGGEASYSETSTDVYGYATMTPGYGKPPVTVTSQYQPYPTCVSKKGDECDKWNEEKYVSTVIKDYDNKDVTVTKTEQVVTIYRTKTTKTNYATPTPTSYKKDDFMKADCKSASQYNTVPDYKTACDKSVEYNNYPADCKSSAEYNGYSDYKSTCDKALEYKEWAKTNSGSSDDKSTEWYELYEKSYEAKFNDLGPHAMVGYPGSGLRDDLKDHQPVMVKEYKNGKWSEYNDDLEYGTPEDVKTYEKPGVYTNPSKDVYVDSPITKGSEAYATAKAGTPVTFGGSYTDVAAPCTVTGAYGAYETGVSNGKTVTSTVVKQVTVYCPKAGKCEIAKPTTTVYDHDTKFAYPTPKVYAPGVYHYDAETVTITKANQPYTCEYKQTKTYDLPKETSAHPKGGDHSSMSTKTGDYPSYATSTPAHGDHDHVSSKTMKSDDYSSYATPTPAHGDHDHSMSKSGDYPSYATSAPAYGDHDHSKTMSGDYSSYATSTPAHGDHDHDNSKTKSGDYAGYATSTPSVSSKSDSYDASYPSATPSSDAYPTYDNTEDEYTNGNKTEETNGEEEYSDDEEENKGDDEEENKGDDDNKDDEPTDEEAPKDDEPKDEQPTGSDNSTAPADEENNKPTELPTNDNSTAPADDENNKPVELPTSDNSTAPADEETNKPVELPTNDNTTTTTNEETNKPVELPTTNNSTAPADEETNKPVELPVPSDEQGLTDDAAPALTDARRSVYGGSLAARARRAL